MHVVAAKLSALDPDAGVAVQVIAQFDALVEGRAGLEPILCAAAAATRCPVRLLHADLGLDVRADPSGRVERDVGGRPSAEWLCIPLVGGGESAIWLERAADSPSLVDAMVLERTAFAAREVLHRSHGHETAAVETLLDPHASDRQRRSAAIRHGLPLGVPVRAVARAGQSPRIEVLGVAVTDVVVRTGIGPYGDLADLPESWRQADLALAFAADGSDRDPGPITVCATELGVLAALADGLDARQPTADISALEDVAQTAPWALRTLDAFVSHAGIRRAAEALFVHHSTLQDRVVGLEHRLGWKIREPQGRFRLQLALAARRYALHPRSPRE